MQFRNFYRCAECGSEWTDVWSAHCDDDCPQCGARRWQAVERKSPPQRCVPDNILSGKIMMTAGVDALPDMVKAAALQAVVEFNDFTTDNDPYGEHDFGSFELYSGKLWKIEYYDKDLQCGSADPSEPPSNNGGGKTMTLSRRTFLARGSTIAAAAVVGASAAHANEAISIALAARSPTSKTTSPATAIRTITPEWLTVRMPMFRFSMTCPFAGRQQHGCKGTLTGSGNMTTNARIQVAFCNSQNPTFQDCTVTGNGSGQQTGIGGEGRGFNVQRCDIS